MIKMMLWNKKIDIRHKFFVMTEFYHHCYLKPKTFTILQGLIFLNLDIRRNDYMTIFFYHILLRHWYLSKLGFFFSFLFLFADFFSHFGLRILFRWFSVLILVTLPWFLWKAFLLPNNSWHTQEKNVNSHVLDFY